MQIILLAKCCQMCRTIALLLLSGAKRIRMKRAWNVSDGSRLKDKFVEVRRGLIGVRIALRL